MRANTEIFADGWRIVRSRWLVRVAAVTVLGMALSLAVVFGLEAAYRACGVQTWGAFQRLQQEMGMPLSAPSTRMWWQMTGASAFDLAARLLAGGLFAWAASSVALRAVRDRAQGWFAEAFGGFARPVEALALALRLYIQVMFWTFLLVVPGIIAALRYSQAWFLKVEHPDWPAGRCIAESARMMDGHKAQLVGLQCQVAVLAIGVVGLTALAMIVVNAKGGGMWALIATAGIFLPAVLFFVSLGAIAMAVFHVELTAAGESGERAD